MSRLELNASTPRADMASGSAAAVTAPRIGAEIRQQALIALGAGLADAGFVAAWSAAHAPVGVLLAGHFLLVAMLGLLLARRIERGRDTTGLQIIVLTILIMGPLGAVASLLILPWSGTGAARVELLEAWYDRIARSVAVDAPSQLAERVSTGRTMDLSAPSPRSFKSVIDHGTLAERQTALGLIARKFHPAYAPALKAALQSREPVVRVQAAAVAARVRSELQIRVRALLRSFDQDLRDSRQALASATEIEAALKTGLLIESDRLRAEAAFARLKAACAGSGLPGDPTAAAALTRAQARTLEAALMEEQRFAALRRLRTIRRIAGSGGKRVRRRADAEPAPRPPMPAHAPAAGARA